VVVVRVVVVVVVRVERHATHMRAHTHKQRAACTRAARVRVVMVWCTSGRRPSQKRRADARHKRRERERERKGGLIFQRARVRSNVCVQEGVKKVVCSGGDCERKRHGQGRLFLLSAVAVVKKRPGVV
jgi:hypothetical protein